MDGHSIQSSNLAPNAGSKAPDPSQLPCPVVDVIGGVSSRADSLNALSTTDRAGAFTEQVEAANIRAAGVANDFWVEKRTRAEAEANEAVRSSRLTRINQQSSWVSAFVDRNSSPLTLSADLDRVFTAVAWYAHTDRARSGDFSGLRLFGVDTTKIEAVWGTLTELAEFYVEKTGITKHQEIWLEHDRRDQLVQRTWSSFSTEYANALDKTALPEVLTKFFRDFSHAGPIMQDEQHEQALLAHAMFDAAEYRLAARLKVDRAAVPLPYHTLHQLRSLQTLMPDSKAVVKLNEALLAPTGANVFLFCCPDYAREKLPGGNYHYTMDGLGTGTGLTGERALPVVNALLDRLQSLSSRGAAAAPANIRIGYADFEATPENANRCGMGFNEHEFLRRLGMSAVSVQQRIQANLGSKLSAELLDDSASFDDPVGKLKMKIVNRENGHEIARITIGRVTDSFAEFNPGYSGIKDFEERVATERQELLRFATADLSTFTEGKERTTAEAFRRALDTLLALRLELMLEWKTEQVPPYLDKLAAQMPFDNKAEVIRSLQAGLSTGDPERSEALRYLRGKIAAQGAEYATMHKLMAAAPHVMHMYADAANMWQLFGKKSIPMLGIRGGYTGADVVDLTPAP